MTVEEVAQALSVQYAVSVYRIPARELPRHLCASGFYYRTISTAYVDAQIICEQKAIRANANI
jgi:hypothetical protein